MASFGGLSVSAVDLYNTWRGPSPGNVMALLLAGNDQISGSTLANLIDGGTGNDTITPGLGDDTVNGGGGADTVVLTGLYAQHIITAGPVTPDGVTLIVTGPGGTDTLTNVDTLQFDDRSIPAAATALAITATDAIRFEGTNINSTSYTFTVERLGDTSGETSVNWSVTPGSVPGNGDPDAADFIANAFPSGAVTFTAGQTSQPIIIDVVADTTSEADESFTVTLSDAPESVVYQTASAIGTITDDDTPCFARGTRILTARGEIAVEHLVPGDLIPLAAGGSPRRLRWIGHRAVTLARHPRPWDVQPVRVHAHAFAPGQPHRDLRLSPDHAVLADGVLIPIRYLINGATIVQENVAAVTYFHLELARADGTAVHDVILAEGLPAESYLDTGNRAAFANGGPSAMLHPDFARGAWQSGCAPPDARRPGGRGPAGGIAGPGNNPRPPPHRRPRPASGGRRRHRRGPAARPRLPLCPRLPLRPSAARSRRPTGLPHHDPRPNPPRQPRHPPPRRRRDPPAAGRQTARPGHPRPGRRLAAARRRLALDHRQRRPPGRRPARTHRQHRPTGILLGPHRDNRPTGPRSHVTVSKLSGRKILLFVNKKKQKNFIR